MGRGERAVIVHAGEDDEMKREGSLGKVANRLRLQGKGGQLWLLILYL